MLRARLWTGQGGMADIWHAFCTICDLHDHFGQDGSAANKAARDHEDKNPGHSVLVQYSPPD